MKISKKILAVLLLYQCVMAVTSCIKDRDGVGNAVATGHKVVRVEQDDGSYRSLEWRGNELSTIRTYDSDGEYASTCNISWQNGNPTKVEWNYSNEGSIIIVHTYSGNNVSQFVYTEKYPDGDSFTFTTQYFYENGRLVRSVDKYSEEETVVVYYTWNKDNLVGGAQGDDRYPTTWEYDTKLNPLQLPVGFVLGEEFWDVDVRCLWSKNNLVRDLDEEIGYDDHAYTYTYTYDGDYPKTITWHGYGRSRTYTIIYSD